ncbi:hypothetical protein ACIA58_18985 [Kribbella sp. NPDC051586]|uniref:hypothetical protein n=1 Tax=Kribbella sp. NPDC051586 TaxID=3364118 RepID=UPI0037BA1262
MAAAVQQRQVVALGASGSCAGVLRWRRPHGSARFVLAQERLDQPRPTTTASPLLPSGAAVRTSPGVELTQLPPQLPNPPIRELRIVVHQPNL